MKHQQIIFSNDIAGSLKQVLDSMSYNKLFVLVDTNVNHFVMPELSNAECLSDAEIIVMKSGDMNKNLTTVADIWKQLGDKGATRNSVLVNIGGGVVTDLGGFAASTFKRGIRFVNVATTLLGAVDAAVGGKTGINFNGLKNEIGAFNEAEAVIISTVMFKTLPVEEIKSGFAEMLKHGLLSEKESFSKLLNYDFNKRNDDELLDLLEHSVGVKRKVVLEDPHEQGIRRALNLGHTVGHAFESMALKRSMPIPHGYAVAWGLIVELVLSHMILKFDSNTMNDAVSFIRDNYGAFKITCDDYDSLISLMKHDKKSRHGELNFTLLKGIGEIEIDCEVSEEDVKAALDIYRDFLHI